MNAKLFLLIFGFCVLGFALSCKKNNFITSPNAQLSFSYNIDSFTLKFDTVFTTTGSVTQVFKIFNNNNQKLRLSTIKLIGGNASAFKINISGTPTIESDNIDMNANDSIYVFVSVTINPNNASTPFIVGDSILVSYNGNNQYIYLQAYGQNANFLKGQNITGNVSWTNTLPYVILDSLTIKPNAKLTITQGCKIYAHANAPIFVNGSLIVNGSFAQPVIFTGDRLDANYINLPASWPGIYFKSTSINNALTFTTIKNANQAIVVQNPSNNANPKLVLHQCIIDNAFLNGMLCINSNVQADNCLISNCGNDIQLTNGGNYYLVNCTATSFSNNNILHKNPVLNINDTAQFNSVTSSNLNASFTNCIFWGDSTGYVNNDAIVTKQGSTNYTILFKNNIYSGVNNPTNCTLTNNILNQNPLFDSIDIFHNVYNFRVTKTASAPGIGKGVSTTFIKDLDNNNRKNSTGLTDIGCYQKQ